MEPVLLGIDLGTSACKTALFDPDGRVLAQESEEYPVYYPQPGWAEQEPEEWWRAICTAVRRTLRNSGIRPEQVAGVGIDGQSWSAIPVDRDGRVLAPTST